MHKRCKQHMALWYLWWTKIIRPQTFHLEQPTFGAKETRLFHHWIRPGLSSLVTPNLPRASRTTSAGFAQDLQILSILEHQAPKKLPDLSWGIFITNPESFGGYIGCRNNLPFHFAESAISPCIVFFFGGGRVSNFWVSNCSTREYGLMLKRVKRQAGPQKTNRRKKTYLETWESHSLRHKPYVCFKQFIYEVGGYVTDHFCLGSRSKTSIASNVLRLGRWQMNVASQSIEEHRLRMGLPKHCCAWLSITISVHSEMTSTKCLRINTPHAVVFRLYPHGSVFCLCYSVILVYLLPFHDWEQVFAWSGSTLATLLDAA